MLWRRSIRAFSTANGVKAGWCLCGAGKSLESPSWCRLRDCVFGQKFLLGAPILARHPIRELHKLLLSRANRGN